MPTPRFYLNVFAMGLIGSGAILTTVIQPGTALNGALWGALLTWFAATRINGRTEGST